MVQGQTVAAAPLDIDALSSLFDELRDAHFRVDVRHWQQMLDVIVAAAAAGEPIDDRSRLRRLIGPLVCCSAADQREFVRILDHWFASTPAERKRQDVDEGLLSALDGAGENARRWRWLIIVPSVLVCVVGLVIALKIGGSPLPMPAEVPAPEPSDGWWFGWLGGALATMAVGAAIYFALWLRLARRFLVRESGERPQSLESLPLRATARRLYQSLDIARAASACRARVIAPGDEIDEAATIQKTVESGGFFSPVFGVRRIMPEYLALIDRSTRRDHEAALIDNLLVHLSKSGVYIHRYYFDGDPRLCFSTRATDDPITLSQLASRFGDYRLLIFADARTFADSVTGEPAGWVPGLTAWPERAAFLPGGARPNRLERALADYITVLPATLDGIAALLKGLHANRRPLPPRPAAVPPPTIIAADPERWLERHPPSDRELDELVASLRAALTPSQFAWMSGCAVYPAMHWNITLAVGYALEEREGAPLVDPASVATLAQLPWFKHAYMPDWLRRRLIDELPAPQNDTVRATLSALLIAAVGGGSGDLALQIATARSKAYQRLAMFVRSIIVRRGDAPEEWSDHVFLRFMIGLRSRPLAFRLPDALRGLLGSGRTVPAVSVPSIEESRGTRRRAALTYALHVFAVVPALFARDRYVRVNGWQAVSIALATILVSVIGLAALSTTSIGFPEALMLSWIATATPCGLAAWRGRPVSIPLVTAAAWALTRDPPITEQGTVAHTTGQRLLGVLLCRPSIYAELARDPHGLRKGIAILALSTVEHIAFARIQGAEVGGNDIGIQMLLQVFRWVVQWIVMSLTFWATARLFFGRSSSHRFLTRMSTSEPPPTLSIRGFVTTISWSYLVTVVVKPVLVGLYFPAMTSPDSYGFWAIYWFCGFWVIAAIYAAVRGAMFDLNRVKAVVVMIVSMVVLGSTLLLITVHRLRSRTFVF